MASNPKLHFVFLLVGLSVMIGCRTFDTKAQEAKDKIQKKIKDYEQLFKDLEEHQVAKGTSKDEIHERYGEPDDIFSSGSSGSGRLEIWSYGKLVVKEIENWHPVRLYFADGKLVDWNY